MSMDSASKLIAKRLVEANVAGMLMWNLAIKGANEAFLRMVKYHCEDLASGRGVIRYSAEWGKDFVRNFRGRHSRTFVISAFYVDSAFPAVHGEGLETQRRNFCPLGPYERMTGLIKIILVLLFAWYGELLKPPNWVRGSSALLQRISSASSRAKATSSASGGGNSIACSSFAAFAQKRTR
jgi:hypothetical protein